MYNSKNSKKFKKISNLKILFNALEQSQAVEIRFIALGVILFKMLKIVIFDYDFMSCVFLIFLFFVISKCK